MSNLTDEKFISIEYDTWVNKYQRLENDNLKLKRELEEEKNNKKGTLHVKWYPYKYDNNFSHESEYGYLQFELDGTIKLDPYRKEIIKNIIQAYEKDDRNLINEGQLRALEKLYVDLHNKTVKVLEENRKIIKGISKFAKWLFKIKSI